MLLLIDSSLVEPPSSTCLFRDITLFATVFREKQVLIESREDMKDFYWKWLTDRGAFDFVQDIIEYNVEKGFTIRSKNLDMPANLKVSRIGYHNFGKIINTI